MSDGSDSASSSESEDIETTGLIATRAKRVTAGNLYATLRANLDDEEIQRDLLAEDEDDDAGDYEGSDKEAEDEVLDSSSDEEDAAAGKAGEPEDDGEKALKRQERVEARKKRKAHDARLKLPSWQKKKRVKLADDVKAEDGNSAERPKKKSERSNWLPSAEDGPVRQSARASAITSREIVHENLKQSAERSERQKRVMKDAAEREKTKQRMDEMSQEERLKKCERIERETAKEFGRWEREEAERQRIREEQLAAKRKKGLDGPFIRHWSGSVLWEGERIKIRRMSHGSKKIEDVVKEEEKKEQDALEAFRRGELAKEAGSEVDSSGTDITNLELQSKEDAVAKPGTSQASEQAAQQSVAEDAAPDRSQASWLEGIHEYAARPDAVVALESPLPTQQAPMTDGNPDNVASDSSTVSQATQQYPPATEIYHGYPPGSHHFQLLQNPTPPHLPAVPILREQAQRTLVMLAQFPSLDIQPTSTKRAYKKTKDKDQESNPQGVPDATEPIKEIILPNAYPQLSVEEAKYLTTRPRKKTNLNEFPLPPAPKRDVCAITLWPAKYRDPKTGLAYADMHQYKAIQRILAGGCAWSGLLGCWVGPRYGALGRPARGVPEGFDGITPAVKIEG